LYRHLAVEAWHGHGLSPANRCIAALILLGALFGILSTEPKVVDISPAAFRAVELALALAFSLEYLLRLYAAGEDPAYRGIAGRLRYMVTPLALVDLLATVPLYFTLLPTDAALLRLVRLISILRLAKFGRYSQALRHITEAVYLRRFELGLSLVVGGFFLVVTATLLYIVEGEAQPESFGSIPRALWWSIMTLTTVGYGDVYPITPLGQIFAAATAVVGIGLIAMPTGILAAAFSEVLQRHRQHEPGQHEPGQHEPGRLEKVIATHSHTKGDAG
jgi:voltage-gated potassium channel